MLMVTRPERGEAWPARVLAGVVFIPCAGAQDPEMGGRLDVAFRRGGQERVRSLRFGRAPSDYGLGPGRRLGAVDRAARVGLLPSAQGGLRMQLQGERRARKCKEKQGKSLAFPWIPLVEFGLFKGLRRIKIKKSHPTRFAFQVVSKRLERVAASPWPSVAAPFGSVRSVGILVTQNSGFGKKMPAKPKRRVYRTTAGPRPSRLRARRARPGQNEGLGATRSSC